jgi:aminoglycoside 3-N-acetyltransferase
LNDVGLFRDADGVWYGHAEVLDRLRSIGAHDCDTLFVHTEVMFGAPNRELKRTEYLDALYHILLDLGVGTLVFPAFSFSFCNREVYDVRNSRTYMGSLVEYIRTRPGVKRSLDPLLSLIVKGAREDLLGGQLGHHSLGPGSGFDRIHRSQNAKFLFFGARFGECFTYVHHVEKALDVPYRFDMPFTGTIIDYDGNAYEDTHYMHTACGGVKPANFHYFKDDLVGRRVMKAARLGDSQIACISEAEAYEEIIDKIVKDINYFLERAFTQADLRHEYTQGRNGERITHC